MSSFAEAMDALGIRPVRAARASDYRPAARPAPVAATGSGVPAQLPGGRRQFANAVPLDMDAPMSGVDQEDDGFSVGGIFKGLGSGILDVVDFGRGYGASGIKELTDTIYGSRIGAGLDAVMGVSDEERAKALENQTTGSWDDFLRQGKEGIGFREVMDETTESQGTGTRGKGGIYSVLGFAGDVISDPLTYLTLGTSTAAGATARGTMRQAVSDGGGRVLAKELAETAVEKGLREVPEVQALVADAFMRGRGAITPRGLARAGIDDVTREALGIPNLARTVGKDGLRIPGSAAIANVAEDAKGAAKGFLKSRSTTQALRKLAPNPLGRRNLMRTLGSRSASLGEKFDAALADGTINESFAVARRWAAETDNRIIKNPELGSRLKALTPEQGRQLAADIENGVDSELATPLRAEFERMRQEAVAMGVDIGDRGANYVPHMVSDEFRALARKNPEAAKILLSLESDVGVQKVRRFGIEPNQENVFLGETLTTGTIDEMNGIAQKKLGVNIYVDDVRDTLPRYIDQMSRAIARAKQIEFLTDKGVVRDKAVKMSREVVQDTPEEIADMKAAKAALKEARDNERLALKDGTTIRRKEIKAVEDAIKARKKQVNAQILELDHKIKQAERGLVGAQMKLARNEKIVAGAREALDKWKTVAKTQRGAERRQALAEIKRLEARIKEVNGAIDVNKRAVSRIMADESASFPQRVLEAQTPMGGLKAWQTQRNELLGEVQELATRADELRTVKLGAGDMPAERQITKATERLQGAQLENRGLSKEVKLAAHALDGAVAERQLVQDEATQAMLKLDEVLNQAKNLPPADRAATEQMAEELRDRVNMMQDLLKREGNDPMVQMMAQFETMALAADTAALAARQSQADMSQLIDIMSTKRFVDVSTPYVEKGMVEIGETMQIPEWLNDALKIEPIKMNWAEANKYIRKFYNLWKGYAILRPGFHVRNAYSAMFNMYLEAGAASLPNVKRAIEFDRMTLKHPEDFVARAAARWGDEEAGLLNEAHKAMQATGSGQAAGEFTSSAFHKGKFNPTSEDFRLLKLNRKVGERVEASIRTAHAYDVLKRGGNLDQAVDVVNKWHFNYTDISSFDRAAKIVMPFWMFFSRNMALQGQTWVRSAGRLNRAYVNADRNLGYGDAEDTLVPEWYGDAGAIRLPGMSQDGTTKYLFPDLPAMQAPAQFDKFMTPWTGQFLGDVGPVKTPFEIMAGKQFFSGIPMEGDAVQAGSGGMVLDKLGVLDATGLGGNGMVDERLQYAINSLIPGAGQLDRYAGLGGDANAERQPYSLAGALTGISVRENNDRTRQGEQYRRMLEEQERARFEAAIRAGG